MKCETCKYWGRFNREWKVDEQEIFGTKSCGKAMQLWDAGEWKYNDDDNCEFILKPEFKEQKMFVKDGSDYMADLYTTADFFCAHHEAKE